MTAATPQDLVSLARLRLARRDMREFAVRMYPKYAVKPHTIAITEHLNALAKGDIRKLAIFMPPRHGKTMTACEMFPAFYFGQKPDAQMILASYTIDRARQSSRRARDYFNSPQWPFGDVVHLNPHAAAVDQWQTKEGGIMKAAGVGGSATGFGADCFPAGTMISTEIGLVDIAELVEMDSPPLVLAFDHTANKIVWRSILASRTVIKDDEFEIATVGGRIVHSTAEHRFYVAGYGYKEAATLAVGDPLVAIAEAAGQSDLQSVPEIVCASAVRSGKGDSQGRDRFFLRSSVRRNGKERGRADRTPQVSRMRIGSEVWPRLLLSRLHKSIATASQHLQGLSAMRNPICRNIIAAIVLLAKMRGQGAFQANARRGKLAFQGRPKLRKMVSTNAANNFGAGSSEVRGLRGNGIAIHSAPVQVRTNAEIESGRSSHRRATGEQRGEQPDYAVRYLPCDTPQVERDSVSVVRRIRATGVKFYDIQVARESNFFANGILAHNCLLIDDPIKDRAEANSPTRREAIWDWYTDVARTRLMPDAREVLSLTRWHDDDLAGRLLNSKGASEWTILDLPCWAICPVCDRTTCDLAENDPDSPSYVADAPRATHGVRDSIGRLPGEVLWPDSGLPLPSVALGEISSRSLASLYQQRPVPEAGSLFRRSWFERRWTMLPKMRRGVVAVDGAWKEGVANDRSAIALWVTDGVDYYLVNAWAGRVEYPDLKRKFRDFWTASQGAAPTMIAGVEDAASGIPLIQEMRRTTGIPIAAVKVDRSKFTRAEAVTPLFEGGKIVLPDSAPWLDDFIEEHCRFPSSKHDDFVDTTSIALARLRVNPGMIFGSLSNTH